jgi:stearoyl-CoA desaturase (delta-9 desaturase)
MSEYQKYFLKVQTLNFVFLLFLFVIVEKITFVFFLFLIVFYFLFYVIGLNIVHRCVAHNQFYLTPIGKKISTILMLFTMVGDPITYSNIHRYHHKNSDTDLDPHTPSKGKFYAFIGWLFDKQRKIPYSNVRDLLKDSFLKFILNHQIKIIWSLVILISLISVEIGLALCCAMWISWIKEAIGTAIFDHSDKSKSPLNNPAWSWIGLTEYHKNHHENSSMIYNDGPTKVLIRITKFCKISY